MIPIMVKVFALSSGFWRVEPSLDDESFLFSSKAQALSFALAWAKFHQPCDLRVYGPLGETEQVGTLPNDNYARPPRRDRRRMQVDIAFPDRRHQER